MPSSFDATKKKKRRCHNTFLFDTTSSIVITVPLVALPLLVSYLWALCGYSYEWNHLFGEKLPENNVCYFLTSILVALKFSILYAIYYKAFGSFATTLCNY